MTIVSAEPSTVDGEVVMELTGNGRRARTFLIRTTSGRRVVRKQFHRGCEANFEREVHALRELREIDPEIIPPLLEVGERFLVIPYYEDILPRRPLAHRLGYRLLPLHVVRRVFAALQRFYQTGYEILDFHAHHILLDRTEGVKLIDLEFAFPDAAIPGVPFSESQTLRGPRPNWTGALPHACPLDRKNYERSLVLTTGLPRISVISHGPWRQRFQRVLFVPYVVSRHVIKRVWHRLCS